jgi:hypothetical protein
MDAKRFDTFARVMARTTVCRRLFFGLALSPLAGFVAGGRRDEVTAKKRHKKRRKPKKPKPNAFGCLEVGDPCANESQCCSGVCEGKKGKRTCRAHDTGTCNQEDIVVPCNNRTNCGCFRTTAGSDVCAALFPPSACAECQRDADCEAMGFPPGSACGLSPIPCKGGNMACFVPCGADVPPPAPA